MFTLFEYGMVYLLQVVAIYAMASLLANTRVNQYTHGERDQLKKLARALRVVTLRQRRDIAKLSARLEVADSCLDTVTPATLKTRLTQLMATLPHERARNAALERQLAEAKAEIADLNAEQAERAAAARQQQHVAASSVSNEASSSGGDVSELREENQRLRAAVMDLRRETTRLTDKVARQAEVIGARDARIAELMGGVSRLPSVDSENSLTESQQSMPPVESASTQDLSVEWKINGVLTTVPLPKHLSEMRAWADVWLGDKVLITRKAEDAATSVSGYKDVPLVYKALLLLGTRAEMMRESSAELSAYYKEMRTQLRLRGGGTTDNLSVAVKDQYSVMVDGQKVAIEQTLKGNSGFDPTKAFRAYFTLDRPNKRVIVAHLPTHLTNRLS